MKLSRWRGGLTDKLSTTATNTRHVRRTAPLPCGWCRSSYWWARWSSCYSGSYYWSWLASLYWKLANIVISLINRRELSGHWPRSSTMRWWRPSKRRIKSALSVTVITRKTILCPSSAAMRSISSIRTVWRNGSQRARTRAPFVEVRSTHQF